MASAKGRVQTVAIGHSRDTASRAAAEAFAAAWQARDGRVLATVDWPESAASWLRPARRLTAGEPDAWVMAAAPLGFVQLARRLRHSTDWGPARTVAFAALRDSRLPALTGPDTLHGLRGATAEGGTWAVRDRWVTSYPPVGPSALRVEQLPLALDAARITGQRPARADEASAVPPGGSGRRLAHQQQFAERAVEGRVDRHGSVLPVSART
ncbi:hypothetical protein [Streptomyces sp. NPDC059850]|uniref:hypothetical protein n=1 Tax=Streptomyces sp. NPDC059850 TaxID=3346970 RepID=UPI00364C5D56